MRAPLGLAALTVLDTAPVEHIALAERHGFDTVGFRLLPAAPGTTAYPLHEDPAARREVRARLADSPVELFDVEIVRLGETFDVEQHGRFLDAAAELGARAVLVGGDDRDRGRLTASYAALAAACAERGLVASLEFMPWTAVPDARTAVSIVSQADGPGRSVLVDALHAGRSTTTLDDLRAIPGGWIHYAQLCDGSVPVPLTDEELVRQAREERLVPGEGGIDLRGIWSTLPAGTPISIELPNEPLRRAVGTDAWLARLVAGARRTVAPLVPTAAS
ncbi:TIM barrel protein [Geodermatophilus sp. YIM 151500]|uniref:sugar phosphate isomerase/epimerase family protein n=1 Tax=Geodermatophilus sp. YIM 151500 TaxID=2984531 RepID=UPI0021E45FFC|nr:TIM barrel protein [Geodermatophilus sp. YIM 151500]MCV2489205.1 TIM barrel protein [Geodermatophilus sp. YIM 151500]